MDPIELSETSLVQILSGLSAATLHSFSRTDAWIHICFDYSLRWYDFVFTKPSPPSDGCPWRRFVGVYDVGGGNGRALSASASYHTIIFCMRPQNQELIFGFWRGYGTIAIAVFDGGGSRVVIRQEDALPDNARIGVIDGIVGRRRRRRRRRRLSRSRPIPVLASSSSVAIVVPLRRRRRRRRSIVAVVVRSSSNLPPLLLGALVARGRRRRWRVRPIVRRGYAACRARVRIGSGGGTRYVSPRRARGERDREHGRDQGIVQEGA